MQQNCETRLSLFALFGVLLLASFGCQPDNGAADAQFEVAETASPAGALSGEPNLQTSEDGEVLLTWIEKQENEEQAALFFARVEADVWSRPTEIARGGNWFVNWADFPAMIKLDDDWYAAHWLAKSGAGVYAYSVHISQSFDGGQTWTESIVPHKDKTETEHGFVSLLPWSDDRLAAIWLDGRNFAGSNGQAPTNEMTLRAAFIDRQGTISGEAVLDQRVCECCQTSAALTETGAIVAYRDRSESEVRDIAIVRWEDGGWSEPTLLHEDNWQFHACPVNGPAVDAQSSQAVIAWFTAANDEPMVKAAFSENGGRSFGEPIQINEKETLGRVDVLLLENGSALLSWMEATEKAGEIKFCKVTRDGSIERRTTLANVSAGRASGFPRMARSGERVYFAWTEVGQPSRVRTAMVDLNP